MAIDVGMPVTLGTVTLCPEIVSILTSATARPSVFSASNSELTENTIRVSAKTGGLETVSNAMTVRVTQARNRCPLEM